MFCLHLLLSLLFLLYHEEKNHSWMVLLGITLLTSFWFYILYL